MTIGRRPNKRLAADAMEAVTGALRAADVAVLRATDDGQVEAVIDSREFSIALEVVAYCTGERARELIRRRPSQHAGDVLLVVAGRITAEARVVLEDAGWSWLDRRGRLHLHAPGVRVDLDVPGQEKAASTRTARSPIAGRSGLTVAYWLCEHPDETLSPTRSAPRLRMAPSSISTAVSRLRGAGLVEDDGAGILPELFWELVAAWRPERTWLLAEPEPADHTTADPADRPSWRRTGTAAAAAYGGPVVTTTEGGHVELYVPGPVEVSVAIRRYGAAQPGMGGATIAVAPVPSVVAGTRDVDAPIIDGWPAAPVLAVALDLAQDRARGREILDDWKVDGAVWH